MSIAKNPFRPSPKVRPCVGRIFLLLAATLVSCTSYHQAGEAEYIRVSNRFLQTLKNEPRHVKNYLVSKDEFAKYVYPMLPASDPGWHTSANDVWGMHWMNVAKRLQRYHERLRGLSLRVVALEGGTKEQKNGVTLWHHPLLTVETPQGARRVMSVIGTMAEFNGVVKILSLRRVQG